MKGFAANSSIEFDNAATNMAHQKDVKQRLQYVWSHGDCRDESNRCLQKV